MANYFICDFGNCEIQKPSKEMVFLKIPDATYPIKRFCSLKHLFQWLEKELSKE